MWVMRLMMVRRLVWTISAPRPQSSRVRVDRRRVKRRNKGGESNGGEKGYEGDTDKGFRGDGGAHLKEEAIWN